MYDHRSQAVRKSLFLIPRQSLFVYQRPLLTFAYLCCVKIGKWNTLRLDRFTPPGAYLMDEEGNSVLLPTKLIREEFQLNDEIPVFLYKDNEARLIATTRKPHVELGQFAFLKVKQADRHGAFLDWGLEKDLLVPFSEQPKDLVEGQWVLIFLFLDDATQRLAATARIKEFYEDATEEILPKGSKVDLLVCERTDLGLKVIVNHRYKGLVFHSDIHSDYRMGDKTVGYVKNVREDGKVDILFQPEGYDKVEPLARKLLQLLEEHKGFLPLTDKSDPTRVQDLTGWSKKTFKQVVGNLYKQRLITISEKGITLGMGC